MTWSFWKLLSSIFLPKLLIRSPIAGGFTPTCLDTPPCRITSSSGLNWWFAWFGFQQNAGRLQYSWAYNIHYQGGSFVPLHPVRLYNAGGQFIFMCMSVYLHVCICPWWCLVRQRPVLETELKLLWPAMWVLGKKWFLFLGAIAPAPGKLIFNSLFLKQSLWFVLWIGSGYEAPRLSCTLQFSLTSREPGLQIYTTTLGK